ncbi:MAG: hypothetical protein ABGY75_18440, partial [Gemmataceae bacterium]
MSTTLIAPPARLSALFRQLADQWHGETQFLSSTTAICTHPAYQRIIGLGPQVIPLILAELEKQPAHWFWALQALTGENPVRLADQGNVPAMTAARI